MPVLAKLAPALFTVGALAAWVVLAVRSPELTYHFAPLVAAAAWPIAARRPILGVASGLLTLAVSVGLWLGDALEGPDFFGGHAAFGEAVLFAVIGAAAGAGWAAARAPAVEESRVSAR